MIAPEAIAAAEFRRNCRRFENPNGDFTVTSRCQVCCFPDPTSGGPAAAGQRGTDNPIIDEMAVWATETPIVSPSRDNKALDINMIHRQARLERKLGSRYANESCCFEVKRKEIPAQSWKEIPDAPQ